MLEVYAGMICLLFNTSSGFVSDFKERLKDVSAAIEEADFISLDGEFTG